MTKYLCKKCNDYDKKLTKDARYPKSVQYYKKYLQNYIDTSNNINYKICKNIVYNLQYLEYLNEVNEQIYLSGPLTSIHYKSFIMIGGSIIEAILLLLCKNNGLIKKENRQEYDSTIVGKEIKNQDNKKIKLKMIYLQYIDEQDQKDEIMTLDKLKNKVQSKKLLGDDNKIYEYINYLRKLRNRIHIFDISEFGTDFDTFNRRELIIAKYLLGSIFKIIFGYNLHIFKLDEPDKFHITDEIRELYSEKKDEFYNEFDEIFDEIDNIELPF